MLVLLHELCKGELGGVEVDSCGHIDDNGDNINVIAILLVWINTYTDV